MGLAFASIMIADMVFVLSFRPHKYISAKLELDEALEEYKRIKSRHVLDKRSERKLKKLLGEVNEKRRIVVRATIFRLIILLPMYLAAAFSASSITLAFPYSCCIPLITVEANGECFILPSMVLLIAYIMFIPFIQESFLSLIIASRIARKTRK